jgi:hypothetical protein
MRNDDLRFRRVRPLDSDPGYEQSVTEACLAFGETLRVMEDFADAKLKSIINKCLNL